MKVGMEFDFHGLEHFICVT
jgi:hypothetical protein